MEVGVGWVGLLCHLPSKDCVAASLQADLYTASQSPVFYYYKHTVKVVSLSLWWWCRNRKKVGWVEG